MKTILETITTNVDSGKELGLKVRGVGLLLAMCGGSNI